jgi:hypothetical protein
MKRYEIDHTFLSPVWELAAMDDYCSSRVEKRHIQTDIICVVIGRDWKTIFFLSKLGRAVLEASRFAVF